MGDFYPYASDISQAPKRQPRGSLIGSEVTTASEKPSLMTAETDLSNNFSDQGTSPSWHEQALPDLDTEQLEIIRRDPEDHMGQGRNLLCLD